MVRSGGSISLVKRKPDPELGQSVSAVRDVGPKSEVLIDLPQAVVFAIHSYLDVTKPRADWLIVVSKLAERPV